MAKVKINLVRNGAVIPRKATSGSGGWDVTAAQIEYVNDSYVKVYLGFALQPPSGFRIRMSPRSSFTKTTWVLQNSPILGDEDYQGEYQLRFRAIPQACLNDTLTYDEFPYKEGDRVAQMWLEEVSDIYFAQEVFDERNHSRKGGFGSTGS